MWNRKEATIFFVIQNYLKWKMIQNWYFEKKISVYRFTKNTPLISFDFMKERASASLQYWCTYSVDYCVDTWRLDCVSKSDVILGGGILTNFNVYDDVFSQTNACLIHRLVQMIQYKMSKRNADQITEDRLVYS